MQPGGTAPRAQVMGYRVAGKTGTAHKLEGRRLRRRTSTSPRSSASRRRRDPRLVVAVMIDEPSDGQYYGGTVAAPVFSQVMAGALRMLAVPPDAPMDNVKLPPANAPEIKEEV